ncbi:NifU family protein [Saprospiraceae bacterium]|nr:NifU family protein [Saprospiraceae bacterium]
MDTATKNPVMLYTEQTPNPETLKYVLNVKLMDGLADFRTKESAEEGSPFATALFDLPYVKGVYINNNYVTITKEFNFPWEDIMLRLKEFIKEYAQSDKVVIKEGYQAELEKKEQEAISSDYSGDDAELVVKIKGLIDKYVKPAVESDGGNIEFKSFHNGVVSVVLQGACSGCPSSSVTLKSGIEGMLKRMVPEVQEVVAEMG